MVKHLFFFLFLVCFAFRPLFAGVSEEADSHYRDSLRRHIFATGSAEVNCYLSYPIGTSAIDPGFGSNSSELSVLRRFLHYAYEDTLLCVLRVNITGYSSPDGSASVNEALSLKRATHLFRYLDEDYRLSENYPVEVQGAGADWHRLRELIDSSRYPWRNDALHVMDSEWSVERKKQQLAYLGGGRAHRVLYEKIYPQLRRVEVKIIYDLQCTKSKLTRVSPPPLVSKGVQVLKLRSMNRLPPVRKRPFHPLLQVGTNLVSLSGIALDGNRPVWRRPMPNLALELFLGRRWSVKADATYARWQTGGDRLWRVAGYSLEPRIWLKGDRRFRGFYVGVYGCTGDFDIRWDGNRTGDYLQGGLSVGGYLPLGRHFGLGLGVRGGYRHVSSDHYSVDRPSYYYDYTARSNRFGLSGMEVSLGYRFGK